MQKKRYDDAKRVMYYIHEHRGTEFIEKEYAEMHAQIRLEAERKKHVKYTALFTQQYIRRTLLGCLIANTSKFSGVNAIQNYQTLMYNALGYQGQTVLLITALYGLMAVIGQVVGTFTIFDHWNRRPTMIVGSAVLVVILAVLTALSQAFPDDHNPSGSRAGAAFIFLFNLLYSFFFNSIVWVIVSEIFPLEIRGVGAGFSMFTQGVTAIWLNFVTSIAFEQITWRFYFVFIATNFFAGVIFFFFLPETNQLGLEEIAARFGDVVAQPVAKGLEEKSANAPAASPKILRPESILVE